MEIFNFSLENKVQYLKYNEMDMAGLIIKIKVPLCFFDKKRKMWLSSSAQQIFCWSPTLMRWAVTLVSSSGGPSGCSRLITCWMIIEQFLVVSVRELVLLKWWEGSNITVCWNPASSTAAKGCLCFAINPPKCNVFFLPYLNLHGETVAAGRSGCSSPPRSVKGHTSRCLCKYHTGGNIIDAKATRVVQGRFFIRHFLLRHRHSKHWMLPYSRLAITKSDWLTAGLIASFIWTMKIHAANCDEWTKQGRFFDSNHCTSWT